MISDTKLKEFFLENGAPNWRRYYESFKITHPNIEDGIFDEDQSAWTVELQSTLELVNYEYAKRGFLKRGKGYGIVHEDDSISFGSIGRQKCYFANKEDAETFNELIGLNSVIYIQT